jgi:phage I-like protein
VKTDSARYVRTTLEAIPLPAEDSGAIPSRFRAMPWGVVELRDASWREEVFDEPGALVVDERSAAEIPANFAKADIVPHINAGHAWDGEAYGWISGVEVVDGDGIYLDAEWSDLGESALKGKRYRYSSLEAILDASPWYLDGSPAVVVAVTGCALTNRPAVVGQQPVAYSTLAAALSACDGRSPAGGGKDIPPAGAGEKGTDMDGSLMARFFARLAGKEPTDEGEAADRYADLKAKLEAFDAVEAQLAETNRQLGAVIEERDALKTELATLKAAETEAKATAAVEAALAEGRISAAMKPKALEMATANLEAFAAFAEMSPLGIFSAPTGKQVKDEVRGSADTATAQGGDRSALHAEVKALQKEKGLSYTEAHAIVADAHRAAGKES